MKHKQSRQPTGVRKKSQRKALVDLATGFWASQAVYVVAKLGVADLLRDGPKSIDVLARATAADALSLARLLRSLATGGIFVEVRENFFGLTPLAEYLQSDSAHSIRTQVLIYGEEFYRAWGELLHSVKTGESAFKRAFGMELYEYLAQNPEKYEIANRSRALDMARLSERMIDVYDFSRIGKIVDVGGGLGNLIAAILKAYPKMRGILFETPFAIAGAKKELEDAGLSRRCELVTGNFFQSVPRGADAYLLSAIICSYDDERALAILDNCRRAMKKRGTLLLIDRVIPAGHLTALHELVLTGGRERTEVEYRALFAAAGFKLRKIVPLQSSVSVIEGRLEVGWKQRGPRAQIKDLSTKGRISWSGRAA